MALDINSKFANLFTSPTRYYIVTGGRGSSKSFSIKVFELLLTYEASHVILDTRYTMNSIKDSTQPELTEKIDLFNAGGDFVVNLNEVTNKKSGSKVIFRGIKQQSKDQTANLKSLKGTTTWILDEAEELLDEKKFDKIDYSIRQKGVQNRVVLILNPTTKSHWIYQRFFLDAGVEGGFNGIKGDITYIHTTYLDNIEHLSDSFLTQVNAIKVKNPKKYEHIMLGGWLDKAEGVIFNDWKYGAFDETLPYIYGQDYGFSIDPTTLVKVAVDNKNMIIYAKVCLYKTGLSTAAIAEVNKNECGSILIVGDSSEPRLIHELKTHCNIKACKKGSGSVTARIKKMQDYTIIVEGEDLGRELDNYTWVAGKDSAPIDMHNHAIDAMGYAFDQLNIGRVTLG